MPLDDDTVVIGTDESSAVVLLDPGIEPAHARLRKTSDGWALSPLDGDVLSSDTNEPLQSLDLRPGEFGRIGRVWITVTESEAAWSGPPPDPVDIEPDDLQGDDDDERDLDPDELAQDKQAAADDAQDGEEERGEEQRAEAQGGEEQGGAPGEQQEGNTPEAAGKRKWSKFKFALPVIVCVIALTAWGVYQFVGGDSSRSPLKPGVAGAGQPGAAAPAEPAPPTQAELRAAFRKRLAEVDLLKDFELNLRDNAWTMQAALDDEEAARFERILAAFVNQHKITFPISAKVGNPEHMLPFKIRQVISGANASVITLDGNRMYVGDEYMGMRLLAIKGSRLSFMGKRKIEVRW